MTQPLSPVSRFPVFSRPLARIGCAVLLLACLPAVAQVAPSLGAAAPFAVLGRNALPTTGTVTCTGGGIIQGQVGTTGNSITNTPPCIITGPIVAPVSNTVTAAFDAAFTSIDVLNPNGSCLPMPPDLTVGPLAPGIYCSAAGTTYNAGTNLVLTGNSTDVWIFKIGTGGPGALTLTGATITMSPGANACNVYWKTSAGMTATDTTFRGNVLAGAAASTTRGNMIGRLMATTDATLTNPTFTGCVNAFPASATGIPTLSQWAMILLAVLLAIGGLAALQRRAR